MTREPGSPIRGSGAWPGRRELSRLRPLLLVPCLVLLTSPALSRDGDVGTSRSALVYGSDDREEAAASTWAPVVRASSVALVPAEAVQYDGDRARLFGASITDTFSLCSGERFADEPSVAKCSGALVAPDLVLTAGHCFHDGDTCGKYLYVFDYGSDAPSAVVPASSVHACREIVAREAPGDASDGDGDFALVRLTHPAADRTPARLSLSPWAAGESLTVIGYPLGLPAKVDTGARVAAPAGPAGFARVASDTFVGSSGSPAFEPDGDLRGIVVAGGVDFVADPSGCLRTRTTTVLDGDGELALPAERILSAVCARSRRSAPAHASAPRDVARSNPSP